MALDVELEHQRTRHRADLVANASARPFTGAEMVPPGGSGLSDDVASQLDPTVAKMLSERTHAIEARGDARSWSSPQR